jgi:O-antigen ligase
VFLKALIVLSPIPFGCVGKMWAPFFYILVLILTFTGIKVIEEQNKKSGTESRGLESDNGFKVQGSKFKVGHTNNILYDKWIKGLFIALLVFIGLQLIPLPVFLVKMISPNKVEVMNQLMDDLPVFTSISLVPLETFVYGLIVVLYGCFFWMIIHLTLKRKEMVSIMNTVIFSAVLQTIFAFLKYARNNQYFYLFFQPVEKDKINPFLTGTLVSPNHFSSYLMMVMPLILALILIRLRMFDRKWSLKERLLSIMEENKQVLFYFVFLILMVMGIFLTGSRAGIFTLVISFMLFGFLSFYIKTTGLRKKMAMVIFPCILFVVIWGGQDTVNKFLKLKEKTELGTGIGRFIRWPATLKMANDYIILGTGLGTYQYGYYLYDREANRFADHAHSDILEVLAEGGLIGSVIFLSIFALLFFSILRQWWLRQRLKIKLLGLGGIISLFAVIFHSFFDFPLRIPSNMFIFILIMVLSIKIVNYKKSSMSGVKREKNVEQYYVKSKIKNVKSEKKNQKS